MPFLDEIILNVRAKLFIRQTPGDTIFDPDVIKAIENAVPKFSLDRPQRLAKEYAGIDLANYPLPSDWDDISEIKRITFNAQLTPHDATDYKLDDTVDATDRALNNVSSGTKNLTLSTAANANFFRAGDVVSIVNNSAVAEQNWIAQDGNPTTGAIVLKNATAGAYSTSPQLRKRQQFVFTKSTPAANEFFKLIYSIKHVVNYEQNTVLTKDQDGFEHLAAALTAQIIAAKYANTQQPSNEIDAIDYGSKRAEWQAIEEAEMELYQAHLKKPWRGV